MTSGLNQCWQPNRALEATRMEPAAARHLCLSVGLAPHHEILAKAI